MLPVDASIRPMAVFDVSSDLDDFSEEILEALRVATGESDVVEHGTWMGCDKENWDLPVTRHPEAKIEVEWLRRKGRFGLDLRIVARDAHLHMSDGMFARAFARALGRPLLFSDCHLFPWSYFMAAADGSIFDVVCEPNDDDRLDLIPSDPDEPGHSMPMLLFGPADELPPVTDDATFEPPDRCGVFGGECPKKLERCGHVGVLYSRR